jgi:hypothetical protein
MENIVKPLPLLNYAYMGLHKQYDHCFNDFLTIRTYSRPDKNDNLIIRLN